VEIQPKRLENEPKRVENEAKRVVFEANWLDGEGGRVIGGSFGVEHEFRVYLNYKNHKYLFKIAEHHNGFN